MTKRIDRRAVAACSVLALWAALATGATAQEGGAPVPPPPDSTVVPEPPKSEPAPPPVPAATAVAAAASERDTTGLVLPALAEVRSQEAIAADKQTVEAGRAAASERMMRARESEIRWRSRAELQKGSIDALKKQGDALKKEKKDAEAKSIESQRKGEEAKKAYYERVRDMYGAEGDFRKAVVEYFDARRVSLEAEGELATRMAATADIQGASKTAESMTAEIKAIDLSKAQAAKMSAMADKERTWADRRKDAYEAWKKLGL